MKVCLVWDHDPYESSVLLAILDGVNAKDVANKISNEWNSREHHKNRPAKVQFDREGDSYDVVVEGKVYYFCENRNTKNSFSLNDL